MLAKDCKRIFRSIKVACIDESTLWKTVKTQIFNDYVFELPTFENLEINEKGAKMQIEFIDYDLALAAYNDIGNDPYLRPFLYLYVVDIKNDEIDRDKIEKINNWIENRKILETTYMVILIQEDRKVFGAVKPINIEQITGSTAENNDIIIFSYKSKKPIPEQLIEEVRNSTRDHIIADCQIYQKAIRDKLEKPSNNAKLNVRFTVWSNLLLFFYGFIETALEGFTKNYIGFISDSDVTLDELLNTDIDSDQITIYPFTENQEPIDSLMFAFYGAMAISHAKIDFDNMVKLFFRHFAFIRSKCVTEEDHVRTNQWGEKAIDTMLNLREILNNQPKVASKLLFKKYLLVEERDGSELESIYKQLRSVLTEKYEITALDIRFLNWQKKKGLQFINFDSTVNIGWQSITKSLEIKYYEAIEKNEIKAAIKIAINLIKDKAQYNQKAEILKSMIDQSNEKIVINAPFRIHVQLKSDAFMKSVPGGSPFMLHAHFRTPKWLPVNFDIALIKFRQASTNKNKIEMVHKANGQFNKPVSFKCYLHAPGTWFITDIGVKYNKILFVWDINELHYTINVDEHDDIPISVDFPRIITTSKQMITTVKIDYSNVLTNSFSHTFSFSDESATIPAQNGEATLLDGNKIQFSINETGKLSYINKDLPDNTNNPTLNVVSIPVVFNVLNTDSDKTCLIIDSSVDAHTWQTSFKQSFRFPLRCLGRLLTDQVLHIELTNMCDIPLTIENEAIGKHVVNPNKQFYVMHPGLSEPMKLLVSDGFGDPIEKVWELDENIMYPRLNVNFEKKQVYIAGASIDVEFDLPKCSFKYLENNDFVIVGKTQQKDFEGGKMNFKIIPVSIGTVETPNVEIDGVLHIIHPRFINVTSASTLSLCPFIRMK
ncbi:hypothetical protein TRFO_21575 [Tritrichomonas foetus]|uniref:Uncharacterized protein n=1 Tax=Tritrichomonas foetus TaxID=1144522 RepID=A0A1J4KDL5_9EUKA|nr:hypothetical protein TRFO_21575 [Tritrichomonas foetus]|eukprot:OHT09527.1 hypothetical protein TRFO_21575 [Tritrichomonas foetus]